MGMEVMEGNSRNSGVNVDFVKLNLKMSFHTHAKSQLSKAFFSPHLYVLLAWRALNKLMCLSTENFVVITHQCKIGVISACKIHKGQKILESAFLILNITKTVQFGKELIFISVYFKWYSFFSVLIIK